MKHHLGYYLISYENFTKGKQLLIIILILLLDYLKEIFNNKKELLKQSDVKTIDVIKYDELSVKNLYDRFMTLDGLLQYFPDRYPEGRLCDRSYMINIANTFYPEIVRDLIRHALE